jgi:NitT/TauT family transport system substrate-binding protein
MLSKNKARLIAAVIALVALAMVAASASKAQQSKQQLTTLRVALNNSASSLPVVVADKQGFFKKNGLAVVTTVQPDITVIPSVLGKNYDLGFTVASIAINAQNAGIDVKIVSGNNYNDKKVQAAKIIAAKDITSVQQLRGKTIAAITLTGTLNLSTKAWLQKNGVDPNSVRFVQVAPANMVDQLQKGLVDAIESNYPFSYVALHAGFHNLGDAENAVGGRTVDSYWLANGTWATTHRGVVSRFKRALDQADRWMLQNRKAARRLAAAFVGLDPVTANSLPLNQFTTSATIANLAFWGNLMRTYGGYTGSLDYKKLLLTVK